jgi:hypothetical protein
MNPNLLKRIFGITLIFFAAFYATHAQPYNVTFNVDMTNASPFNPATDDVYISGSMAGWPMPGSNPSLKMLPQQPGSMIYTITLSVAAGVQQYKYFRVINNAPSWDHGEWPGDPNRTVDVSGNMTVSDVWAVFSAVPIISWANLQWPPDGQIIAGESFDVYAQVYIYGLTGQPEPAPGVQAWIGYSTSNTDPSTWTNWVVADFLGPVWSNDEYTLDLGAAINQPGTYYYASRFKFNDDPYVYGGYSEPGGGFWNGTDHISGILTIEPAPDPEIVWANLAWPPNGEIELGGEFNVYAQVYIPLLTGQTTPATDVQAWIGYNSSNTNPAGWTNWVPATYNTAVGNNDEYMADIGSAITASGTWYYASRFKFMNQEFVYGGYAEAGGGFWNGTDNVSGVLSVSDQDVYQVSVLINPPGSGTAGGAGLYPEGASVTLSAAPANGYLFLNWTENGQVVSAQNPYTFTMTANNRTFTANFQPLPPPQVTFSLDMSGAIFNPETEHVYISGPINGNTIPGSDPAYQLQPSAPGSMTYQLVMSFETGTYHYKYYIASPSNPGFDHPEWEVDIFRLLEVTGDITTDDEWGVYTGVGLISAIRDNYIMYPNPAKNFVKLSFSQLSEIISEVNVISPSSQVLVSYRDVNATDLVIDISALNRGVYFIEIKTGQHRAIQKLIVL